MVNGLTGKYRDQTLQLLITAVCAHGQDTDSMKATLSHLAARLEHHIFKSAKVSFLFR